MSCAEPLQMTRDFFDKFNIAYTVLRKSIPVGKVFFYHQSQIWKLFFRIKTQSPTYVQKTTTGSFNSLRKQPKFWTPPMVSPQTDVWGTSTEIPYWWRFTSQILSVLPIGRAARVISFNQSRAQPRPRPDQGSDTSSVWNFCTRFSDVISWGNQWCRREMLAVFSAYSFSC